MTVIAYSSKHRTMAADSRMAEDGAYHLTSCQKIVRLKSGALLGLAGDGDARDLVRLLDRLKGLPSRVQLAELECSASSLLVQPSGLVYRVSSWYSREHSAWLGEVVEITDTFVAIGSGAAYAYGALEVGASPRDAVLAACRRDLGCALPVQVEPVFTTKGVKS